MRGEWLADQQRWIQLLVKTQDTNLSRGSSAEERRVHIPEARGSIPFPATSFMLLAHLLEA